MSLYLSSLGALLFVSLLLLLVSPVFSHSVHVEVSVAVGSSDEREPINNQPEPVNEMELDSTMLRDTSRLSTATGHYNALLVQVQFPDKAARFKPADFQAAFLDSPAGVTAYYRAMSFGALDMTTSGSKAVGDASGNAIMLDNPRSYYANNFHGFNTRSCPRCIFQVAIDALTKLNDQRCGDFAEFAQPDGTIPHVFIVFSGPVFVQLAAGADQNRLLPTAGSLQSILRKTFQSSQPKTPQCKNLPRSNRRYTIDVVTFCEELSDDETTIATPRRCIHEFGHSLGLPDLYDFNYVGNGGMGFFDLMAYGAYANALTPAPMSSFTRSQMGWTRFRPVPLFNSPQNILVRPLSPTSGALQIYIGNNERNAEYFLVELRQRSSYANFLDVCDGLAVFHADESVAAYGQSFQDNLVNTVDRPRCSSGVGTCPPHRGLTMVEADGGDELTKKNPMVFGGCSKLFGFRPEQSKIFQAPQSNTFMGSPTGIRMELQQLCTDGSILVKLTGSLPVPNGARLIQESCSAATAMSGMASETLEDSEFELNMAESAGDNYDKRPAWVVRSAEFIQGLPQRFLPEGLDSGRFNARQLFGLQVPQQHPHKNFFREMNLPATPGRLSRLADRFRRYWEEGKKGFLGGFFRRLKNPLPNIGRRIPGPIRANN